ncbi:hypothetical protein AMEX_G24340 [Astyanax mexicanus]|uniref:Uncharacterized protein n=1 Tax=Astyanax mexicanus TaxID=7994 RepID=A0A8T2KSX2_ASTMX|nr:hypothetical protein AMEX_G24340 [Astyanax mexicanus]
MEEHEPSASERPQREACTCCTFTSANMIDNQFQQQATLLSSVMVASGRSGRRATSLSWRPLVNWPSSTLRSTREKSLEHAISPPAADPPVHQNRREKHRERERG